MIAFAQLVFAKYFFIIQRRRRRRLRAPPIFGKTYVQQLPMSAASPCMVVSLVELYYSLLCTFFPCRVPEPYKTFDSTVVRYCCTR
jgi:hypothetical protein